MLIKNHPLLKDSVILPTEPLEEFVTIIRVWIENLLPGGIIYGQQRSGKSQAVKYLIKHSEQLLGAKIPVAQMSMWHPTPTSTSENRFFGEILAALNYAAANSQTAAIKRFRIVSQILDEVHANNEHRFILFIDEAQLLSTSQLRYLMDIHNQLKMQDVRLICILVGQPELKILKEDLVTRGEKHLIARFMIASHRFTGMTSSKQLSKVMKSLDTPYKSIKGNEVSVTESFSPKAYANGFRIHLYADLIWETIISALEGENINLGKELPMQPVTAFLRLLMIEISHRDEADFEITEALIEKVLGTVSLQFIDLI